MVTNGQKLNKRNLVANNETVRSCNTDTLAQGLLNRRQIAKENKGNGNREKGQDRSDLLPS